MNNTYDKVDFPALIGYLKREGFSVEDIADRSGFSKDTICTLFAESREPSSQNKTVALLLMFRDETGLEFPRLGDHHDVVPEKNY